MMLNSELPKVIRTPFGLRDKLTELFRDLSYNNKSLFYYKIQENTGIFYNRKTLKTIIKYIPFEHNTYKLQGGEL